MGKKRACMETMGPWEVLEIHCLTCADTATGGKARGLQKVSEIDSCLQKGRWAAAFAFLIQLEAVEFPSFFSHLSP